MAAKLNVAIVEQWIADGETRITKLLLQREREAGLITLRLDERVREFERHLADWRQLRLRLLYGRAVREVATGRRGRSDPIAGAGAPRTAGRSGAGD